MNEFENRVTTMLFERAAVARPFDQFDVVMVGAADARVVAPRRLDWRHLVAVAATLALVVGGLFALARRDSDSSVSGPSGGSKFSFVTQQVSLTADDLWIDVSGQRFTSKGAQVNINSAAGDSNYQTLELIWTEHGVEMRLNIYFQNDGNEWASNEFRTYNGKAKGDWVSFTGDFFRSPLGSAFTGEFDQRSTEGGVTSHIHIEGLRLQAFLALGPGGVTVPTSSTVPELVMSDLRVPPLPAGLPQTGATLSPEDGLVMSMAEQAIVQDCMDAKGWVYPVRTAGELAVAFGSWANNDVRGAAARALGYHEAVVDPTDTYAAGLSAAENQRFGEDMMGGPNDVVPFTAPDGSVVGGTQNGGCFRVRSERFGDGYLSQQYTAPFDEVRNKAVSAAATAPALVAALSAWSQCVQTSVGETAASPDELAGRYSPFEGSPTDREKQVAVADADCERQVDLWTVYNTAIAQAERALMGADVGRYDDLTRLHQQLLVTARQILAERNITPPPLD